AQLLRSVGLDLADLNLVTLAQPDAIPGLANRSIDGTGTAEPTLTEIVARGIGVLYKTTDEYAPDLQAHVLAFSPEFAQNADAGRRFVAAYLRGARLYHDAFHQPDPAAR